MEMITVSKEEYETLKLQIDIIHKFLAKTFGSSFLEFCKSERQSPRKENNSRLTLLSSVQGTVASTSSVQYNGSMKGKPQAVNGGNKIVAGRRPPPLLHRPNVGTIAKLEPKPGTSNGNVASFSKTNSTSVAVNTANGQESDDQQEFYTDADGIDEDVAQFLQPETVFSDEEQQGSRSKGFQNNGRNGVGMKREHAVAFDYEEEEEEEHPEMHLPEGTECIVIESDQEQEAGQTETYEYKQEEEFYDDDGTRTTEEMFDEDGYSYSMVEDGLEVTTEETTENYQAEELKTDGNVTFGTVYTDPQSGMQYFQCSFCPSAKVFKHKQSLKEHYLLNHSPTPPAYQCQCGRRFLKQSQLKRHEVVHTAERPFVCPICLKDFTRKDNMTVHMVRNHAEKKHPCPYCPDKIYATPAEVNRHLRMYHSQWQQ